jgi:hypothetical protein
VRTKDGGSHRRTRSARFPEGREERYSNGRVVDGACKSTVERCDCDTTRHGARGNVKVLWCCCRRRRPEGIASDVAGSDAAEETSR